VWIIKGLAFLFMFIGLLYVFLTNGNQAVDLHFFGHDYLGISIYWVVLASYLLGFLTSFLLAAVREFRFHRQISGLKKMIGAKDREIADLRTLPLRQELPEAELPADSDAGSQ